jgi:hypothetical protein
MKKIFLGYQLCQLVKNNQCFKDHLSPHHQGYHGADDGDGPWNVSNF